VDARRKLRARGERRRTDGRQRTTAVDVSPFLPVG
jgi:hypothetical protein